MLYAELQRILSYVGLLWISDNQFESASIAFVNAKLQSLDNSESYSLKELELSISQDILVSQ